MHYLTLQPPSAGIIFYLCTRGRFPWQTATIMCKQYWEWEQWQKRKIPALPKKFTVFSEKALKLLKKWGDLISKKVKTTRKSGLFSLFLEKNIQQKMTKMGEKLTLCENNEFWGLCATSRRIVGLRRKFASVFRRRNCSSQLRYTRIPARAKQSQPLHSLVHSHLTRWPTLSQVIAPIPLIINPPTFTNILLPLLTILSILWLCNVTADN